MTRIGFLTLVKEALSRGEKRTRRVRAEVRLLHQSAQSVPFLGACGAIRAAWLTCFVLRVAQKIKVPTVCFPTFFVVCPTAGIGPVKS